MTSADKAPALVDDLLHGITCRSASDCWAVGESLVPGFFGIPFVPVPGTPAQTLTEHWDGSSWSVVTSANSGFSENILDGVACSSASNCWAVGIDNNGSSAYDALIEQYNGTVWSIAGGADPSQQLNELDGAWCGADGTCRAAGIQRGSAATQTLVEQTTPSGSWTSDSGADTSSSQLNGTTGITCTDDSDCWAVGEYDATGNFLFQTLVEMRTSAGWVVVPSADVDPTHPNVLWGVTCADAAECWTVGYATDKKGVNHTLVEGTATSPPAPLPDVTPMFTTPAALLATAVLAGRSRCVRERKRRSARRSSLSVSKSGTADAADAGYFSI